MAHLIIVDVVPPTLTYRDESAVSSTDGTHTHSGLTFGPASSDRALIALVSTNVADTTAVSVTIGGVAASRQSRVVNNFVSAEIWIALVPTGTSGSVVLSGPSGSTNWSSCVGIYSITSLLSRTATDTSTDTVSGPGSLSTNVTVQPLGVVVSVATESNGSATSATWTGATRNYFNAYTNAASGASFVATSGQSLTVTTAFGGATSIRAGATASFR